MPNNFNVPPSITSLDKQATDFGRIADALERIATALEKLTGEKTKAAPIQTPKPQTNSKSGKEPATNGKSQAIQASATSKNTVLHKYLAAHGITPQEPKRKLSPQKQELHDKLEQMSLHLGQNFVACQEFYKELKNKMKAPHDAFEYSLKGDNPEKKTAIRRFCELLKSAEVLQEYSYKGKPECIMRLKAIGKEHEYLKGRWLESFVEQEVARIAKPYDIPHKREYKPLPRLKIKFEDNTDGELDLFFALGEKVFCVEAKVGTTEAKLKDKLAKIKPLELGPESTLIVVADKSEEECQELSKKLGNVRVTGLANLEETVISMLKEAL